jgi:hypothetical protein
MAEDGIAAACLCGAVRFEVTGLLDWQPRGYCSRAASAANTAVMASTRPM